MNTKAAAGIGKTYHHPHCHSPGPTQTPSLISLGRRARPDAKRNENLSIYKRPQLVIAMYHSMIVRFDIIYHILPFYLSTLYLLPPAF